MHRSVRACRFTLRAALTTAFAICGALSPAATTAAEPASRAGTITVEEFDALVAREVGPLATAEPASDPQFLRRATFDLVGRLPTLEEQRQFAAADQAKRDRELVERLLASESFGANWADYWRDAIAYHIPPPELTYLNYGPFKAWLAGKLNANRPWDEVVRELITAKGKLEEQPAATFIGYHNAEPTNLAGEVSRLFLGQQIGCAQCHDHPFDRWKRTEFHALAAFFARTKVKLSQNDGLGTVVSSLDKGDYLLPDMADPRKKGSRLAPAVLGGKKLEIGPEDDARREQLAAWITAADNPWFAKAYVNRVWARLMGRGFYEPVDDLGDSRPQSWPAVHEALAKHFTATGYDVKDLYSLVTTSAAYRRVTLLDRADAPSAAPPRMRGDEVFAALKVGAELENVTPPAVKPTAAIRFPPPPKSTRDKVNDAFGTDPSLSPIDAPRTIAQALWMMNHDELQRQIDAKPGSGTMLSKLLAAEPDDKQACRQLFQRVLAREATDDETRIALEHITALGDRGAAFEDLLWGLLNTAEFTTRK